VTLTVKAAGFATQEQRLALKGGEVNNLAVKLEPGAPIVGTVVDTDGAPVSDAEISVGSLRLWGDVVAHSDENGRFLVNSFPADSAITLTASHEKYAVACVM
jgi:hypothetical protein